MYTLQFHNSVEKDILEITQWYNEQKQGLGNELTDVPYLFEFTVDMAQALLQSKSLNLGALLYDETVETAEDSLNAIVYKQMPFYSEAPSVRMGTSIDLFLTTDTNKVVHTVKEPQDTL